MTRVKDRFVNEGWTAEVPSGSGTSFTLAFTPDDPLAVKVYIDGLLETAYSISGTGITLTTALAAGQSIYATYTKKL